MEPRSADTLEVQLQPLRRDTQDCSLLDVELPGHWLSLLTPDSLLATWAFHATTLYHSRFLCFINVSELRTSHASALTLQHSPWFPQLEI